MRYVLAGSAVLIGAMLIGLAVHDKVLEAWRELST